MLNAFVVCVYMNKVFFLHFFHWWSLGSLTLSPFACLDGDTRYLAILLSWLHRQYKLNIELHKVGWWHHCFLQSCFIDFFRAVLQQSWIVCCHLFTMLLFITVKLLWNHLFCIKRYINKGDLTWLDYIWWYFSQILTYKELIKLYWTVTCNKAPMT